MPITYFFKKHKNKVECENVNNKHSVFIDDYENNEDEHDEIKHDAVTNDVACGAVTSNDNNHKMKVNKRNVDESGNKEACVKCKINYESSSFTEVMYETLVSELKEE